MKTIFISCIALLFCCTMTFAQQQLSIEAKITNVKSNEGSIMIGLYKTSESFLKKPYKSILVRSNAAGVQVTFENIEPGEYAISLYHDEDDNKELNTILGIPTEPYATSNNAKGRFGPPKWEDAKFTVSDKTVTQNISF